MCARGAAASQEGGLPEGKELRRCETNSWIQYSVAGVNLQAGNAIVALAKCSDYLRLWKTLRP